MPIDPSQIQSQLVQLFMDKYKATPQEAARQANFYLLRPQDEMANSFIYEAMKAAQDNEAKAEAQSKANAASQPVPTSQIPHLPHHDVAKFMPPAPTPLITAAATPAHVEDANIAAWQRYSQMLESMPPSSTTGALFDNGAKRLDAGTGVPIGKRR